MEELIEIIARAILNEPILYLLLNNIKRPEWPRGAAMILSIITMNVLPEKQKELIQTILSMNKALEKEAGCMSCAMFSNIRDKNNFNLFKEWHTRKDLNKYLMSEMFGILLGTNSLLCEPFKIKIYTVSKETVNLVRKTGHPSFDKLHLN